jgi:hypothetical protein
MAAPEAILFDLWGTLVPGIPPAVRDAVSLEMAADLGVDPAAFAAASTSGTAAAGNSPVPPHSAMDVVCLRVPGDAAADRYDDGDAFTGPEIVTLAALLDRPDLSPR